MYTTLKGEVRKLRALLPLTKERKRKLESEAGSGKKEAFIV